MYDSSACTRALDIVNDRFLCEKITISRRCDSENLLPHFPVSVLLTTIWALRFLISCGSSMKFLALSHCPFLGDSLYIVVFSLSSTVSLVIYYKCNVCTRYRNQKLLYFRGLISFICHFQLSFVTKLTISVTKLTIPLFYWYCREIHLNSKEMTMSVSKLTIIVTELTMTYPIYHCYDRPSDCTRCP